MSGHTPWKEIKHKSSTSATGGDLRVDDLAGTIWKHGQDDLYGTVGDYQAAITALAQDAAWSVINRSGFMPGSWRVEIVCEWERLEREA